MTQMQYKKRFFLALQAYFRVVAGVSVVYTFILASMSDSNEISDGRLFVQIIGCVVALLVSILASDFCEAAERDVGRRIYKMKRQSRNCCQLDTRHLGAGESLGVGRAESLDMVRIMEAILKLEQSNELMSENFRRWLIESGMANAETISELDACSLRADAWFVADAATQACV